jgi:long-chain acyl-CoA synthetase
MRCVDEHGFPVPVGAPGEVVIRGHNVMKGYYKRPEETAKALHHGWFHTGDVGKVDEEGYFFIVDRLKDMIIRGGFNVYPREVEEVLMTHPAVSLAAVVGLPDPALGEEIQAFVVCKPGHQTTVEELIHFCKGNMAAYKYPRVIEFRDTLPMNATGKILKSNLRNEINR